MKLLLITSLISSFLLLGSCSYLRKDLAELPAVAPTPLKTELAELPVLDGEAIYIGVSDFKDLTGQRKQSDNYASFSSAVTQGAEAWLIESLKKHNCDYIAASGTVTRVASASFGELEDKDENSEIEIRASWTPTSEAQLVNHLQAWLELLELTAGLEPIPEGVSSISRKS